MPPQRQSCRIVSKLLPPLNDAVDRACPTGLKAIELSRPPKATNPPALK